MSKVGPQLLSTKDGRAYAKFNGRKISFGCIADPDCAQRFDAFKARWLLNGRELTDDMLGPRAARPGVVTLDALAELFLAHLKQRFPPAWQANNLHRVEHGLKPARELYGPEPAADFTPKKLEAVRRALVTAGKLSRKEINRRILEIRRCIRWAVAQELVPGDRAHALEAVDPLGQGEFGTREGRVVGPVERETVDATLPYLTKPLAALVQLLWLTGARPSELFRLTPADIDRSDTKSWAVNHAGRGQGRRAGGDTGGRRDGQPRAVASVDFGSDPGVEAVAEGRHGRGAAAAGILIRLGALACTEPLGSLVSTAP